MTDVLDAIFCLTRLLGSSAPQELNRSEVRMWPLIGTTTDKITLEKAQR